MKIRHHSIFNNNLEELNWESLRNDEKEIPYYLPYSLEEYLYKVDTSEPCNFIKNLISELTNLGLTKLFSIGCGIAAQEYQLKKFSDLSVTVSDYSDSVFRLKDFNIFDECLQFNALKDRLPADRSYLMFLHRIDTEFDDQQLKMLFKKCHEAGVRYICFVPAEILSFKSLILELKLIIISLVRNKPRVFCGYSRSKGSFKLLWKKHYKLKKEFIAGKGKVSYILESIE